jgi:replicative DNA helicase
VFIAARPSMGKTELALDIIDKVSEQGAVSVLQHGNAKYPDR